MTQSNLVRHSTRTTQISAPRAWFRTLPVANVVAMVLALILGDFAALPAPALQGLSPLHGTATHAPASSTPDPELQRITGGIRTKLDDLRVSAGFPGATVGFVLSDGTSGSISTGLADVETKTALARGDRMLAGSIGKTYVAAVMLQLAGERKINLDEKIEHWLGRETWFGRLPNATSITLRMLMNHSSGIPEHVLKNEFISMLRADPDRKFSPAELVAYILGEKPLFPAGQGFSYADTNYILVGMIFERISGRELYPEIVRRILRPLKLERTIPSDRRVIPGLITGYSSAQSPFQNEGRTIIEGKCVINPQMEWAGGGMASTAEDLARWAKALYEGKVLKPSLLGQMLTGVEAKEGRGSSEGAKYGLACQIRPSPWGVSYGHGGWFPGYLSEVEYFPGKKLAIAIQFNTDDFAKIKGDLRAYINEMAKIILGES